MFQKIKVLPLTTLSFALFSFFAWDCSNQKQNDPNEQRIVFEEYFPLKNNTKMIYTARNVSEGSRFQYPNDTNVFKIKVIKNRKVFYIDDTGTDTNDIVASNAFCFGVFYFEKGDLYYSPIFWEEEMNRLNLDYFEVILPKFIQLDSIYKHKRDEEIRKYRFVGFEDLEVNSKKINKCLKMISTQDWPTAHYVDTVWFQKGVGVIKWYRSTGRLEEIK